MRNAVQKHTQFDIIGFEEEKYINIAEGTTDPGSEYLNSSGRFEEIEEHDGDKGRVRLPNRINFRKSAKGGAGVHFQYKIYIGDFGPLYGAFSDVLQKQIAI